MRSRDLNFPLGYFVGEDLAVSRLAVKTLCREDIRVGTVRNKKFPPQYFSPYVLLLYDYLPKIKYG